jgi:proline racemase
VASALGFVNVGFASAVERGLSLTCQRSDSAAERHTLGKYIGAINEQDPPKHPEIDGVDHCHHVEFIAPGSTVTLSRHAMPHAAPAIRPRMAELWARGELTIGEDFVNESIIGRRFTGRLIGETTVAGLPAVVPTITGRAWVTGLGQYLLDPHRPCPTGIEF